MKIHTLDGYIQTLYLAVYPDKLLLLDGASRADIPNLKHYITHELGRPFSHLTTVVVTHMHPDHAGAAHKLRDLTGCQVVSALRPNHWYRGIDGFLMHLTDIALARWVAQRKRKPKRNLWYPRKLMPDVMLSDGEAIPNFPDWTVLETPGHTDRDLSLYHSEQGVLYVADLMVEVKQKLIAPFPVFYPNQYRTSLQRVYDLAPQSLLIAHGGEVVLSAQTYQHLVDTAPRTPTTHWRAFKIKLKSLFGALWAFGINKHD
ncbi:MBL fold metallo-hydrolase [Vibrio sp. JPW-9-11-11]|uniref:MBL fold metallo-hydrolase n=1 Tax=Vibrio sp. JPW-9-11-11 TaxID=1416532 RepID=UPI00159469C6|nr:MBL fold metallo-hydrolase [Vibrio sp. JPW-9-11-11]NVD06739.1 MBL fold metallo-hydrolase [Vibrio sp. JPW-9-11-11]